MAAALFSRKSRFSSLFRVDSKNSPSFIQLLCNSPCFSLSPSYCYLSTSTSTIKPPSSDVTTPPPDFFVQKYHFSPQIASKAAAFTARMRNPQNTIVLLSYLKQKGFSDTQLERIVSRDTQLLSSSLEESVEQKLKIFQDLGLSASETVQIVARDYNILHCQANRIVHSLSVLKRLLGSNDNVIKLIKKSNDLFYVDPEKTLLPNIEFLKSCGVPMEQINTLIYTCTRLLQFNPEKMRKFVHKVDEMGVDRTSKAFIYAVYAVSKMSDESWELKLKSFQDLSFSEDDILRVFRTQPMVFTASTPKLKKVKEVLLETRKYDMSCIVNRPQSLLYSVEKRYKPRLQVLNVLEKKGLIEEWPKLSTLGSMTDELFCKTFVTPYVNEIGEAFIANTSIFDKAGTCKMQP